MHRFAKSVSLAFVIGLAAAACLGSADGDSSQPDKPAKPKAPLTFKVVGQAQTAPESVIIHFAVVGDGDTLNAAEQEMQKTQQSVIGALDKQGVKQKDMQLEGFTATPLQPNGMNSSGAMKPLGYRVQRQYRISMPVTSESLDKVLKVADAALAQGARPGVLADGYDVYDRRQPSLMEFTIRDPEKLTKQAMNDGLMRARKLAEQAVAQMGYGPGVLKLIAVHACDSSGGPNRYDSPDERVPVTSFSWQPVKALISIEAEFDVK